MYGNRIPFLDTSSVTITVADGDDVLGQVNDTKVELSADSLVLNVMVCLMHHGCHIDCDLLYITILIVCGLMLCMKEFLFKTSKLDALKPMYEAQLKIASYNNEFFAMCPCKGYIVGSFILSLTFIYCSFTFYVTLVYVSMQVLSYSHW